MRQIKKFEPLSVMKMFGMAYGALGIVEGALFSVMFAVLPMAAPDPKMPRLLGLLFGGLAIVFCPILFGLMGAVSGGLGAVIYNVSARYVGGIQVETE